MKIKTLIEEDFTNYKKPSLFVGTCLCDWKCCLEAKIPVTVCQNSELAKSQTIEIEDDILIKRYLNNPLTSAIVFGGLEPFKQFDEILLFIKKLREEYSCEDDIVIYTGYYPQELIDQINQLKIYKNIIIKFGRYIPNQKPHFDAVLGINLASNNQYAQKIL